MQAAFHPPEGRVRHGWVAVLLCLMNPAYAMLYLGRAYRALAYFTLSLLAMLLAVVLASRGLWPAGLTWVVAYLAVVVAAAIEAIRIAKRHARDFVGPWYTRWYGLVAVVLVLGAAALAFRVFLYEPFRQPSESMAPTLRESDLFFVDKRAYASRAPQRGDIIVFRLPTAPDVMYVKRLVGLPRDVVVYDGATKRLTINGTAAPIEELGADPESPGVELARELLDGRSHLQHWHRGMSGRGGTYIVPDGHYFALGDNRDNSQDSRHEAVGFIPLNNIVGKAVRVLWNTEMPNRAGTVLE